MFQCWYHSQHCLPTIFRCSGAAEVDSCVQPSSMLVTYFVSVTILAYLEWITENAWPATIPSMERRGLEFLVPDPDP